MKVHILDDWFDTLRQLPCFAKLSAHDVTVWTDHCEDIDQLASRLAEAEALVLFRERTKITRALLERLPTLRLISQRGTYPHIDVEACTDNNILLCSKKPAGEPNYSAAELTFNLMQTAMRGLPREMASLKAGTWQAGVGRNLRGKTLGLYGYGRIAKALAHYAEAFGMSILWWASEEGRQRAKADGQTVATSREDFFARCDIISIHLRLSPETRGIITAKDLAAMKDRALFVNTARAGLIEEGALLAGLEVGRPLMAAIDVFDTEPLLDRQDPLLSHPNLIGTPHIGFVTEEEYELQFSDIFDQITAYANGNPIHVINETVLTPRQEP
ncbi:D-2-hydroxyacid dehydrogenase family protein [uncultured Cohaesibacter sp.]|uniref:D-2-hydroxyacid dehydrogenase family protein n=1 Tax=uncultured Cohaesibacter sp. TaxID=1002546 RepID=UPI0029C76295|nr:D-2-hydroxyacid dehydrogenase family protein [uncultured Cohaesibacter sp.]